MPKQTDDTNMAARIRKTLLPFAVTSFWLLLMTVTQVDGSSNDGYFSGGTVSFYFVDEGGPGRQTYKAHVTVITGWVLGHGPCGPGCSEQEVGRSTHNRRLSIIQSTGNPVIFGNWSTESEIPGKRDGPLLITEITDIVNKNIQGRISSVSSKLKWEQEIARTEIEINPIYSYTDIVLHGSKWRPFDLNTGNIGSGFRLQTKIRPNIRSDTNLPNSSPLVLYQPIYRLLLDSVTEIRLTSSDKDGDLIECRKARNVEIEGIGAMENVEVSKGCVISINASSSAGFANNTWGVVALALEDFTRKPMTMGAQTLKAYDAHALSSSILDFMVWVVDKMSVPEFVSPTPISQHVYTVYAGSVLSIPLAARPDVNSPVNVKVVDFHVISLPDHPITAPKPQQSPQRVVTSRLEWRTSDSDKGDFIIQVVAIDSESYESQDRNYKIHVSDLHQERNSKTNANPYFPFFPKNGTITCLQNATCSVPIFAKPGTSGHVISSIHIVTGRTDLPVNETGQVEYVQYRGMHVYRTDVHFTTTILGNKTLCLRAQDNYGLATVKCVGVTLEPANPCDVKPCHEGMCTPNGVRFSCVCPPTVTGPLCEQWLDPCLSAPCQHGSTCLSRYPMKAPGCMCATGYTGPTCETDINDCARNPCKNGGICVDELANHHCVCPHGFTGQNCETTNNNDPCVTKGCHSSSTCVVSPASGLAECKCPLGRTGTTCSSSNGATPLTQTPATNMPPHSVVPTLRPGSYITCKVGQTCQIPVYLRPATSGSNPNVIRGITSPDVMTSVSPATTDPLTGLPNVMTSTMSVTPQKQGNHSACLEVGSSSGSATVEQICYVINTPDPKTVGLPTRVPANKAFTDKTPPDGSVINCVTSQPCHILPRTQKPPSGTCEEVIPASEGAIAFATTADPNSDTCATDILLSPSTTPSSRVCLVVGSGGEQRCYTVNTVDDTNSDPCSSNPCMGNGACMPSTGIPAYTCVCHVPYTGTDCQQVEDCSSNRCENQAVCVNDASGGSGFQCQCQPGYGPASSNCRHESSDCSTKNCQDGALCVMEGTVAKCQCHLTKEGSQCQNNRSQSLPIRPGTSPSKPHAVMPSLRHGTTIHCDVGSTCQVPVYMTGNPAHPPHVSTGATSPEVTAHMTPPTTSPLPPATLNSSLSITPTQPGNHHVCVDIRESASSVSKETICYNINSANPSQGPTTTPPTNSNQGKRFVQGTPQNHSKLACEKGRPCHIIAMTEKLPSGQCAEARTQSVGVYTFPAEELGSSTCATDVVIDPSNLQGNQACISVGLAGEKRCFPVSTLDPAQDPCNLNNCQNGAMCIPDSSAAQGYVCACPVPYAGPTCSAKDGCVAGRCLNQAVCTDTTPSGFTCACQPGYGGDDCRHVPDVCSGVQCENGALCVEDHGQGRCKCPLGIEGDTCGSDNTDLPINPNTDLSRPHVVVPSLGNGHIIKCNLNQHCQVPILVTGTNPRVSIRLKSPTLTTDVTTPVTPSITADTVTSKLTVTPKQPGTQHVCVDVGDGSGTSDTVCYVVQVDPTTAPTVAPTGGRFSGGTPPHESTIVCRDDTPCHLMTLTHKTPGSSCDNVQSKSVGVYSFHTNVLDQTTCTTDVLIDPATSGPHVCVQVGYGGEERCYTINTVNSANDPCANNADCKNGGRCIPDGSGQHQCLCPNVLAGSDCGTLAQNPCNNLHCENGGQCFLEGGGHPVCKCPVGKSGPLCKNDSPDIPLNKGTPMTEPHAVIPTPGNGLEIRCDVGDTCSVPVYVHAPASGHAEVTAGQRTPGISGSVSPPSQTSLLPDTQKATLTVTPTTPGDHHVCVDIKQSNGVDSVCYTVKSQGSGQISTNPHTTSQGGHFSGATPPHEARIPCYEDKPCHVIVQTAKPASSTHACDQITTHSTGTFTFGRPADSQFCNTDVLVEPKAITGNRACLRVGQSGEERCYTIDTVSKNNKCSPANACHQGGQCVLVPSDPNGYKCVCPTFYTGPHCDTDNTDQPVNKGASRQKPHVVVPTPTNGMEIACDVGTTCTIPVYTTGGGRVALGPHTSSLQAITGATGSASQRPNTAVTPLEVTPTSQGRHHACVDILDNSGVVDNICYTVVGKIPSSNPMQHPSTHETFKEGTPPNGAHINCRSGVPCQVMVHTNKPPSEPCIPVLTSDKGVTPFSPVTSSSAVGTCDSVVLIDPVQASGNNHGNVCILAALSLASNGEKRCYTVNTITDAEDKCSAPSPCQTGGECVLSQGQPAGYLCVCPDGSAALSCPKANNQPPNQGTSNSQTPNQGTSNSQTPNHGTSNSQTPNQGTSNSQTPNQGTSNSQTPNQGTSNSQTPNQGTSNSQTPNQGTSNSQTPNQGTSNSQTPNQGTSNSQTPNQGTSNNQAPNTGTSNHQPSRPNASGGQNSVVSPSGAVTKSPAQQCAARRDAFKQAAQEGRLRCTCINPSTNQSYTVVRPRVSNQRLLRAGGISSAVSGGGMMMVALAMFVFRKLKGKLSKGGPAVAPPNRGFRLQMRGSGPQWQETGYSGGR